MNAVERAPPKASGWLHAAWTQVFRPLLAIAFFATAGWFLWRQLEHLSWRAFLGALTQTRPQAIFGSILLTIGSYACLAATETVALRALGHRLSYLDAARVAVPAYALTNSAGFSPATGTLFRVQMYRSFGLDARASAVVAMLAGAAVSLSGVVTAGLVMLADPLGLGRTLHQPAGHVVLAGVTLTLPALLWFCAFTRWSPQWLGGGRPHGGARVRILGLGAGVGDWLFSSAALYILLPDHSLAVLPAFLCAYIVGALLSAATGVPGGIGVFEAIVLALTALLGQLHETTAALLLYRCIYSFGPLGIWGVVSLVRAVRRRGRDRAETQPTARKPSTPYWSRPLAELFAELGTSVDGLGAAEAERRLHEVGPNVVRGHQATSAMRLLLRQFQSPLVLILIFAGVVAGALQNWLEAAIIVAMVLGSTLLGYVQEHRASHAVERLRRRLTLKTLVRRAGRAQEIALDEVAPGDVVLLSAGAIVPADAVLSAATNLLVTEAALTGESFPVEKRPGEVASAASAAERLNCVFAGSSVRSGAGEARWSSPPAVTPSSG